MLSIKQIEVKRKPIVIIFLLVSRYVGQAQHVFVPLSPVSCHNICALFFAHVIRYTIHLYVLYSYLILFSHVTFILPHENAHTTLTYYLSTFPSLALLSASSDVHRVRWTHCCIMAHVPDYRNFVSVCTINISAPAHDRVHVQNWVWTVCVVIRVIYN